MKELLISGDASVFHCDWRDLVSALPQWHNLHPIASLIVDAPYSEKTHAGHDEASLSANRNSTESERRAIAYTAWSPDDVSEFVSAWSPNIDGWFVSITDDQLAPAWTDALLSSGRYVFSPIACVEPGSRVRILGDGPAQWSCWAVVARPRSTRFAKWGALPGAYVVPPGFNARGMSGRKSVVGGKPDWLMDALVRDYSRPGDIVCDPCCGAGTTGTAALRAGRRFIGCDALEAHAKLAAKALSMPIQRPLVLPMPGETVQQPITFQDS